AKKAGGDNMTQPLFLKPVFQERIWGGTALRDEFGYEIPSEETGECWAISGHSNGPSVIENGPYAGKTLIELWDNHRALFGNTAGDVFPLLTKILDANADLSVQVHPDDAYAKEHENGELGKTECWYISDCKAGAEIIYGHHATTKEEFTKLMEQGEWDTLLRRIPIEPGDFFYLPSGTIHALCEGTLVLETQQNSDTTYRVYDYDRKDQKGNKRDLHLKKALDVSTIPHQEMDIEMYHKTVEHTEVTTFVEEEYFTVKKWEVSGETKMSLESPFVLGSVIAGKGTLTMDDVTYSLEKGQHFILPNDTEDFLLDGAFTLIVSHP